MSDCLFCSIVSGDIPSKKVYEDDLVMAFEDIAPMMPVHLLVIPRDHYDSVIDDVPEEVLGHLLSVAGMLAREKSIDQSGFRILINTNDDARQSVHHLHVHVLGGAPMNDGNPGKDAE